MIPDAATLAGSISKLNDIQFHAGPGGGLKANILEIIPGPAAESTGTRELMGTEPPPRRATGQLCASGIYRRVIDPHQCFYLFTGEAVRRIYIAGAQGKSSLETGFAIDKCAFFRISR